MDALTRATSRWCVTSLLILSLAWLQTSCAATGEPFRRGDQVPGKSSLYIYREHALTGSAWAWDVYLDSEKVAELRTGGYFYSTISPGLHTVLVKVSKGLSVNISIEPDHTYYFRVGAGTNFTHHVFELKRVPEDVALSELQDMKLQPLIK